IPRLKEYVKTLKKPVELLIDIPGIVKELGDCDFAITAGGNTLFERIAAMKPGVTICQLDRQMEIADKFAELGVNYNLGYGPEMSAEEIFTKISSYLHKREAHLSQIKKAPEYVDGNGLSRVANIFVNLIRNNNELL
ncbi:MAG: hypothetical protein P8M34_07635, partial [Saprospiraceae bacterium]|nr:hypothetical protein [Saprospiraceae bacterium]